MRSKKTIIERKKRAPNSNGHDRVSGSNQVIRKPQIIGIHRHHLHSAQNKREGEIWRNRDREQTWSLENSNWTLTLPGPLGTRSLRTILMAVDTASIQHHTFFPFLSPSNYACTATRHTHVTHSLPPKHTSGFCF